MINLMPNEDQDNVTKWARDFLDAALTPVDVLKNDVNSSLTTNLMRQLAELGCFMLTVSEANGGGGLGYADEALVYREFGHHLVPGPLVATSLAARLAFARGDAALGASFGSGAAVAGLAEVRGNDDLVLWDTGSVDYVLVVDPKLASFALVSYRDLPAYDAVEAIDPYYRVATLALSSLPAPVHTADGETGDALLAHGRVLTAAYLTGLAESARDDSAAYAKQRVQFGKPIGTFQAVKHRCADNAVRAEAAWAQTAVAAVRLTDVGARAAEMDIAAAKIIAGNSAILNARDNIQNHGGMGYTAENVAHLYLKRAHLLVNSFGDARSFTELMLEGVVTW